MRRGAPAHRAPLICPEGHGPTGEPYMSPVATPPTALCLPSLLSLLLVSLYYWVTRGSAGLRVGPAVSYQPPPSLRVETPRVHPLHSPPVPRLASPRLRQNAPRQINQLASPFDVRNRARGPVPTPPLQAPGSTGSLDGEVLTNKSSQGRADAQRLVATRLLDRLHDPLGHFSRLQRIYPRAR